MSFLAQQTSAASYAHLMLSFYNCLPAQRSVVPGMPISDVLCVVHCLLLQMIWFCQRF